MYKYKSQETRVESYHQQVTLKVLLALQALWYPGDVGRRGMQGPAWPEGSISLEEQGQCWSHQFQTAESAMGCPSLTAGVDIKTFAIDPKSCGIDPAWEGCGVLGDISSRSVVPSGHGLETAGRASLAAGQWGLRASHPRAGTSALLPQGAELVPVQGPAALGVCLWKWKTGRKRAGRKGGCCGMGQGVRAEWAAGQSCLLFPGSLRHTLALWVGATLLLTVIIISFNFFFLESCQYWLILGKKLKCCLLSTWDGLITDLLSRKALKVPVELEQHREG